MAKTVDLRTYLLLERAFVRRLQRAWRIQSAPLYARITQACLDHKWDEARRLVTFLDMTEVGTQNREWITYMLLSFATFGAQTVAKKKPSFVGVGTFDRFLKQVTNNIIQYLEFTATAKIQEDALHLIATDEAHTKAQKRDYVRDEQGRFAATFNAWFGQSKVVDKEGHPLVVYHGTLASVDFEEFNKTAELGYHFGTAEQANYRTTDYKGRVIPAYLSIQHPIRMPDHVWDTADTATKWAAANGFDPDGAIQREHEAHTTALAEAAEAVGHAYYHGTIEEHRVLERAYAERKREHRKAIFRLFKAALEAKGYDGIVYENEVEGAGDSYIAFYPHQIKSAIGNIGAFDPKDPRITKFDASQPRDAHGQWTKGATGTAAFQSWFGESQVVDDQGKPLVVYHGTTRDVEAFTGAGSRVGWDTGFSGEGYYFGSQHTASIYAGEEHGSNVLPVYLKMEHPLRIQEVAHNKGGDDAIIATAKAVGITVPPGVDGLNHLRLMPGLSKLITAKLRERGHDGVIYTWAGGRYTEYMVPDPTQIKSALGNREFDPKDSRITKWDESEHPRDKAGKFTESSAGSDAMLDITLEAASPERAKIRLKVVRSLADEVAHQMGFDPSRIDVVDEEAKGFSVGEKQFTEAGHYDPATGRIYLNSANITYDETPLVKGVISHEISHAIFHELKEASKVEEQAFLKKAMTPTDQYSDWYLERFSLQKGPSGRTERRPKPEYLEELARDYPASTVLAALGDGYFKGISRKMVEENGHSEYAKTYWDPKALEGRDFNQKYDHAITETIAEITRYVTKSGWYEMTKPSPDSPWVKLTVAMHQWYQNRPKAA